MPVESPDGYLGKPFYLKELLTLVAQYTGR
jgi:hypothetical protein